MGWISGSVSSCLELSVGCLELSAGCLELSAWCLALSVTSRVSGIVCCCGASLNTHLSSIAPESSLKDLEFAVSDGISRFFDF